MFRNWVVKAEFRPQNRQSILGHLLAHLKKKWIITFFFFLYLRCYCRKIYSPFFHFLPRRPRPAPSLPVYNDSWELNIIAPRNQCDGTGPARHFRCDAAFPAKQLLELEECGAAPEVTRGAGAGAFWEKRTQKSMRKRIALASAAHIRDGSAGEDIFKVSISSCR